MFDYQEKNPRCPHNLCRAGDLLMIYPKFRVHYIVNISIADVHYFYERVSFSYCIVEELKHDFLRTNNHVGDKMRNQVIEIQSRAQPFILRGWGITPYDGLYREAPLERAGGI